MAFLCAILMSFLQVLKEQTTFEEKILKKRGTLPSLTICEFHYENNQKYKTLQDVMDSIEEKKQNIIASILYQRENFDLKNQSILKEKFNTTYDQVWSHSATMFQDEAASIITCTTLNLDFIKKPDNHGTFWLNLTVYRQVSHALDNFNNFYLEKHMPGQSLHNYQFDWVDGLDILYTKKGHTQIPIQTETISLNTRHHHCNQYNSLRFTQCIDDFMTEYLNCSVPWITNPTKPKCEGEAKLEEFRQYYRDISTKATKEKIKQRGCFQPNCEMTSWKNAYVDSFELEKKNGTRLWFGLPSNTYTIRREEILLKDFPTFVADCGSYLGLFLGASVLSITDIIVSSCKKLVEIFQKRQNDQNEVQNMIK